MSSASNNFANKQSRNFGRDPHDVSANQHANAHSLNALSRLQQQEPQSMPQKFPSGSNLVQPKEKRLQKRYSANSDLQSAVNRCASIESFPRGIDVSLNGVEIAQCGNGALKQWQSNSVDLASQQSLGIDVENQDKNTATYTGTTIVKTAAASGSMEDTAQLKAMAEVDVDRINRERNSKLQFILNSNIQQREKEFGEAQQNLQRQQNRVGSIHNHLSQVSQQLVVSLEDEHVRQQIIKAEEQTLLQQKEELETAAGQEKAQMQSYLSKSSERRIRLDRERKDLEHSATDQRRIKESLKGRLEALKKREEACIEQKVSLLRAEDDKILEQLDLLKHAKQTLEQFIEQQLEQKLMLTEDMLSSSTLEQQLVIHSEELEGYSDKIKGNMLSSGGCQWSATLQHAFDSKGGDEELMNEIVDRQTRQLVVGLVRELQRYMMNHCTGTTDSSQFQSSMLDDLEKEAEASEIVIEKTLRKVIDFASSSFQLDISEDQLSAKIAQIKSGVNLRRVQNQLEQVSTLTYRIDKLQCSIMTLQRRVGSELVPLHSAMIDSEALLEQEMCTTAETITDLSTQHDEIQNLMDECKEKFACAAEGMQLQSQIKHLRSEIKLHDESIANKVCQIEAIIKEIATADDEIADMQAKIESLAETTAIQSQEIQKELDQLLQNSEVSYQSTTVQQEKQRIVQLQNLEEKLKHELQTAQNRLKYASQKVEAVQVSKQFYSDC